MGSFQGPGSLCPLAWLDSAQQVPRSLHAAMVLFTPKTQLPAASPENSPSAHFWAELIVWFPRVELEGPLGTDCVCLWVLAPGSAGLGAQESLGDGGVSSEPSWPLEAGRVLEMSRVSAQSLPSFMPEFPVQRTQSEGVSIGQEGIGVGCPCLGEF